MLETLNELLTAVVLLLKIAESLKRQKDRKSRPTEIGRLR